MSTAVAVEPARFSRYQRVLAAMLAFLQFAVVLDFMLMSPLGAVIMPALKIGPKQFGLVVSGYAFSAAASGLLTAGFADRYDRKKLLLFFYAGFILGTLWCGLAQTFEALLLARIVTGLFGGVIGSVVLAITADLFPPQMRGRVMGLIQTAFSASQVLGIPFGLYLSNRWDWHVPFLAMAALGVLGGLVVVWRMHPVADHLKVAQEYNPWFHMINTLREPRYLLAFCATAVLTTGGFMLMPFSSAYVVGNLGIDLTSLPTLYLITGMFTIFCGPLIGKAADAFGKFRVFAVGTTLSIVMVLVFTHLGRVGLPLVVAVNVAMFVGIFSRMIPFQALMASVPEPVQRGSFSAINASVQQLSGGIASVVAGHIVTVDVDGRLRDVDTVGYIVVSTTLLTLLLVWRLTRDLNGRPAAVVVTPQLERT
jgi:predicted MFS family arabinose efflux permease